MAGISRPSKLNAINLAYLFWEIKMPKEITIEKRLYMKLVLVAMIIATMMPVALSSGDYLSPSMGQKYPTDWLEGGYVRSYDRSMFMDEGIAGMVRWLDAPVYSFPWYSTDLSFYKRAVPVTVFSPYKEYYTTTGTSVAGGIVSTPAKFNIAEETPTSVYYGTGQGLPYPQYASIVPSKANDLWIQGAANWTQYAISPLGATLQLVANVPVAGVGGFYEAIQNDTASMKFKTYQFYQGYNNMSFSAERIGRYMLYFVVNNQPSNVVIIDVFAQEQPGQNLAQSSYSQVTQPTTQYQTNTAITATAIAPTSSQSTIVGGDTPVTIQSRGMRGYQVFLDENYIGTEGAGGDLLDGLFSFRVIGGQNHNIRVYDGQFNYPRSIYFARGVQKIINVEPGTAVYI